MTTIELGGERVTIVEVIELSVCLAPGVADPTIQRPKFPFEEEFRAVRCSLPKNEVVVGIGSYVLVRTRVLGVFHQIVEVLVVQLYRALPLSVLTQVNEVASIQLTTSLGRDEIELGSQTSVGVVVAESDARCTYW